MCASTVFRNISLYFVHCKTRSHDVVSDSNNVQLLFLVSLLGYQLTKSRMSPRPVEEVLKADESTDGTEHRHSEGVHHEEKSKTWAHLWANDVNDLIAKLCWCLCFEKEGSF